MKKIYVRPVSEIYAAELGQMVCASQRSFGYTADSESAFNEEDPQPNGTDTEVIEVWGDGPASTSKEFDLWGDW